VDAKEMLICRAVSGSRIAVHKRNGDIGEELQKSEIYRERLYERIESRALRLLAIFSE
jgi:hypothetical protein